MGTGIYLLDKEHLPIHPDFEDSLKTRGLKVEALGPGGLEALQDEIGETTKAGFVSMNDAIKKKAEL